MHRPKWLPRNNIYFHNITLSLYIFGIRNEIQLTIISDLELITLKPNQNVQFKYVR